MFSVYFHVSRSHRMGHACICCNFLAMHLRHRIIIAFIFVIEFRIWLLCLPAANAGAIHRMVQLLASAVAIVQSIARVRFIIDADTASIFGGAQSNDSTMHVHLHIRCFWLSYIWRILCYR